jgi:signal transduction histidine kinase
VRRDIFLIFKEAVNNAARHSQCVKAAIEVSAENGCLTLSVSDDGKGFDATQSSDGQGVLGMRQRAESFSGKLEIISQEGHGTIVRLHVPISRRLIHEIGRRDANAHHD